MKTIIWINRIGMVVLFSVFGILSGGWALLLFPLLILISSSFRRMLGLTDSNGNAIDY